MKPNLTLINKLLKELNTQQEVIDKIKNLDNKQEYVVELSKALGLITTLKMEAEYLSSDYLTEIKGVAGGVLPKETDLLSMFNLPKVPKN